MIREGFKYRTDFRAWWPNYDAKPEACFGKVQRALTDMDIAIMRSRGRRQCVQAGGHAGLWPQRLAGIFREVYTFEPEPNLFECLKRNASAENVRPSPLALGAFSGTVNLLPAPSAGSWRVDERGTFPVQQTTIDALDLHECDAIFLDVEGYEVEALKGGRATIERCRPVVMVEILPRSRDAIASHMESIGYVLCGRIHSDAVYVPR